jgi:hypothetical protein
MKKVLAILAMAAFVACGDNAAKEGEKAADTPKVETPAAPTTPVADTAKPKDTVKPAAAPADAKKDTGKAK